MTGSVIDSQCEDGHEPVSQQTLSDQVWIRYKC